MLGFSAIAESPIASLASDFEIEVILTDAGVLIWTLNTFSNTWIEYTRNNTWSIYARVPVEYQTVYSSNEWVLPDKSQEWNL